MALDALPVQRAHEIAHADVHVTVVLYVDPPVSRPYRLAFDTMGRAIAEVHVGLQAAEVQHKVRLVHPLDDRRRAYRPYVDAHIERMVHREGALAEYRRHYRRAHLLGQLDQISRDLIAMNLDTGDQHRLAAFVEHRGGLARRFLHMACVGFVKVQMTVPFDNFVGHFDLAVDHVAMDLDVTRALLGPDRADHVVKLHRGAPGIGQHGRGTRDFLVNAMLGLYLARLMVNQRAQLALFLPRSSGQDEQGHALGKRARHRVDHVVPAGAVGHTNDADLAGGARVSVGGETDTWFMREGKDLRPLTPAEREKQLEGEVARDAENVSCADLAEIGDQKVAHRHVPFHPRALLCVLRVTVADWRPLLAQSTDLGPNAPVEYKG